MTYTLLVDLDDTLLGNDIHGFLPEYLSAFSRVASDWIDPQQFTRAMLRGTQAMIANRQPDCTLQEAFEASFFADVSIGPDEFYQIADRFYEEEYPKLRVFTHRIPEAVAMITGAFERGWRVAVTTNPLFPRTAIVQRLEWGGFPVKHYPFEIVSSFEKFHSSKPDPAFYSEMMSYLGWPAGPVIVIGDDPVRDVAAASAAGFATFWIAPGGQALPDGNPQPTGRGSQSDLLLWLDSTPEATLVPDYTRIGALIAGLRSTPAALDGLCRDVPVAQWITPPAAGEWSLTEITCHLRDVETEVNIPRIEKLLETGNPFIAGQDTDRWAETRDYIHQNGPQALGVFSRSRMKLVSTLDTLSEDAWQRPARHAIFGPTRLIELVGIMAAHDRLHVQQTIAALQALAD